ncbi:NUD12 pyrophosphatase, partial [Polyodon spathula]|nr:NUD12 pyrophosphatase [Polyodon spathula]
MAFVQRNPKEEMVAQFLDSAAKGDVARVSSVIYHSDILINESDERLDCTDAWCDRASVNKSGQTALDIAKFGGQKHIANLLANTKSGDRPVFPPGAAEEHENYFCRTILNRMSEKRTDSEWLKAKQLHSTTVYVLFSSLSPLVTSSGEKDHSCKPSVRLCRFGREAVEELLGKPEAILIFLGIEVQKTNVGSLKESVLNGVDGLIAWFALSADDIPLAKFKLKYPDCFLIQAPMPGLLQLTEEEAGNGQAVQARSVFAWHSRYSFCPTCGSGTKVGEGGYKRSCLKEGCKSLQGIHNTSYPRVDPVVIMLVIHPDGNQCLLGRKKVFPAAMFSCLAGFIEPASHNNDTTNKACENGNDSDLAVKGAAHKSQREDVLESDVCGENEPYFRHESKRSSQDTPDADCQTGKEDKITPPSDKNDKGVTITTRVKINDQEVSTLGTITVRHHPDKDKSSLSVTTTKVKCTVSNIEVEVKEVLHSADPDFKAVFVVECKEGKRRETCTHIEGQLGQCHFPNNKNPMSYCSFNINVNPTSFSQDSRNDDADFNKVRQDSTKCDEDTGCYKSCCKDCKNKYCFCNQEQSGCSKDTDYSATEWSSRLYPLSDCSLLRTEHSSDRLEIDMVSDIPPPDEFADKEFKLLDEITEDMSLFHINNGDKSDSQTETARTMDESTRYMSGRKQSNLFGSEHSGSAEGFLGNKNESDCYNPMFMSSKMPVSRSSFTKDFIHKHEGKTWLRNNSIAILETKSSPKCYLEKQPKRRKTFPGPASVFPKMHESLLSYRESISSGTFPSFFMKSLPLGSERRDRVHIEHGGTFFAEHRTSSDNGSDCRPSSSHISYSRPHLLNPSASVGGKHPFYPSESEESTDEVYKDFQHNQKAVEDTSLLALNPLNNVCTSPNTINGYSSGESYHFGSLELAEFAESGFNEEIDNHNLELSGKTPIINKDLMIQVTPPSRSISYEHIGNKDHVSSGVFDSLNDLEGNVQNNYIDLQEICEPGLRPKTRRGEVKTVIIGDSEKRLLIQNDNSFPHTSVSEKNRSDFFTCVYDNPSVSPTLDVDETETEGRNMDKSCESKSVLVLSEADICQDMQTNGFISELHDNANNKKEKLQKTETLDEKPSVPKSPKETKTRTHLKLPCDHVLKDMRPKENIPQEESERWAKRRMRFKDSKQKSSAGGSSNTSIITEESVNSEENRSVDLGVWENEDKGFYTETFHSASWIYRGDDVRANDSPRCLSKRPRPAAIRERTVKIIKGTGDYPWGFRIQFSKPILVTEVDTNGPAEEAGLLMGDIVMSVNGTDVTSIPHSEAAALARQGPDILILVIGSDISKCPNTPKPACRGYLHKRTQSGFLKGWRKRWFVLKHDGCFYYYKHKKVRDIPVTLLQN